MKREEYKEKISVASDTDFCNDVDEQEQQIRRSARYRQPPDRLAYFSPGHSINNVQTIYKMPSIPNNYHFVYVARNNQCYRWKPFADQLVPITYCTWPRLNYCFVKLLIISLSYVLIIFLCCVADFQRRKEKNLCTTGADT